MNYSVKKVKEIGFIKCDLCNTKKFSFSHYELEEPMIFSMEYGYLHMPKEIKYKFCNKCVGNSFEFLKELRKSNVGLVSEINGKTSHIRKVGTATSLVEDTGTCLFEHVCIKNNEDLVKILDYVMNTMQIFMQIRDFSQIDAKSMEFLGDKAKEIFSIINGKCVQNKPKFFDPSKM